MYVSLLLLIWKYTKEHHNIQELNILTIMYAAFYIGGITESMTDSLFLFPMLGLYLTIKNNIEDEKNRFVYGNKCK